MKKGAATPLFYLPSTEGKPSGPAALRSKYNMVLTFVEDSLEGSSYLEALASIYPAILDEQARVVAVIAAPIDTASSTLSRLKLPYPLLADEGGHTTQRMLGSDKQSALCVADRFGQVYHIESVPRSRDLPPVDTALEWLAFIQIQCPE